MLRLSSTAGPQREVWNCAEHPSAKVCDLLSGCDAVIHCAAYVHRPIETAFEKQQCVEINSRGTERLIKACQNNGPTRFVFASTIAVYGSNAGVHNESSPVTGTSVYASSKLDAEKSVEASTLDWSIVRLSTIYGTGDKGNFQKMIQAIKSKRFLIPGGGSARKSIVSIDQAGELFGKLALLRNPKERVFNLAQPYAPTLSEICLAFCRVCELPVPRHVPIPILVLAAKAGDLVARLRPNFPFTSDNLRKLTTSTVVDTARQQQLFPEMSWPEFETDLKKYKDFYKTARV